MLSATQKAERQSRNNPSTIMTSIRPSKPLEITTSRRLCTSRDLSFEYSMFTPWGNCCRLFSINARMPSTVLMMSADSFLYTSSEIPGVPFIRDRTLADSKSSLMTARSLTLTVEPPSRTRTMTSPTSMGFENSANVTMFFSLV